MTWSALIVKNLLRRPVRTVLTAIGVGLGVGLIVALLAITNGVPNTASDLTHVGGADFGVYQSDVSDFTRSLLPESMAATNSPGATVNETSWSARTRPRSNALQTFSSATAAPVVTSAESPRRSPPSSRCRPSL
jgi:hypothetical protein